jgi:hypothetical protein
VAAPDDGSGASSPSSSRDGSGRRGWGLVDEPFLDIRERIASGGNGVAWPRLPSGLPDDPRFFVDYTDVNGDTVIAEYQLDDGRPDVGDRDTERILLQIGPAVRQSQRWRGRVRAGRDVVHRNR